MTIAELVVTLAPSYAGDARIAGLVTVAATRVSAAVWLTLYDQAVAYLVIHMLIRADRQAASAGAASGGGSGDVMSLREGQAAIGFGAVAGTSSATLGDAALTTTWAGLEYLSLRAMLGERAPGWAR